MRHRATFLLLILVLCIAPVANAWCSTVCIAAAISGGCAHGLQPTDDLPVDKAAPAPSVVWVPFVVASLAGEQLYEPPSAAGTQHTPLRI